ncbi:hypothetical protein CH300_04945 [Rhodococcus sp. 15-1154-1]|nr:hypothetical protein CH300_04945 [Rhodococcus sp. 15-1154-1]
MGRDGMSEVSRLQVRDLSVSYGRHEVVRGLSFDIPKGKIYSLLGSNGSGKSTTVKALTGVNTVGAETSVLLNGKLIRPRELTPSKSRSIGIRVVHQESPLIPNMTVAEMAALNTDFPLVGGTFVHRRQLQRRTREMLDEFDVRVDPSSLCGDLKAGERALVSLVVSMAGISPEQALLILDETTAPLSTRDAERFLDRVRSVADRGLAVLMVTHRLPEVSAYSDNALVLRDGVLVRTYDSESFSEQACINDMVGGTGRGRSTDRRGAGGRDVDADKSTVMARGLSGVTVRDVTVGVGPGEILGVTGRAGEGASELLRVLSGVEESTAGSVVVEGNPMSMTGPREAIAAGIYYLSLDRLVEGGIPLMTVRENMILPDVGRYGFGGRGAAAAVQGMIEELDIRPPDADVAFGSLSGGNQQKVLLARWLLMAPKVLVLDDPAAGVDPNTREIIFDTLRELSARGTSIIIRSSEPEHLVRLCDRVVVVNGGRIVEYIEELTLEEISRATYA